MAPRSWVLAEAHRALDDHVAEVRRMLYRFIKTLG